MFAKLKNLELAFEFACKLLGRLKLYFSNCAFNAGGFKELTAQNGYFLPLVETLQMLPQTRSFFQLSI
jgi:hypothetical protein